MVAGFSKFVKMLWFETVHDCSDMEPSKQQHFCSKTHTENKRTTGALHHELWNPSFTNYLLKNKQIATVA